MSEGSGKKWTLGKAWAWSMGGREGHVAIGAQSYQ